MVVVLLPTLAACGASSQSSNGQRPVNLGELFSLTGKVATFGTAELSGVQTAVKVINANGGVLGQKITEFSGDEASDPIDAVPATRLLLTHNLTFFAGPSSLTLAAVRPIIDSAHIPDFLSAGSNTYANLNDPLIFRVTSPDAALATAMARYALNNGYSKCSILIDNTQASQSFVAPLTSAFTSHGGTVAASVALAPGQASYRTEVVTAFANSPQCVFISNDPATDGTLFADLRELGHLNVPFIGSNIYTDPREAKAIGAGDASRWVTGVSPAAPSGPGYQYLESIFASTHPGTAANVYVASFYDGITIAALAMTAAGSTDPAIWRNDVTKVTNNESATECHDYADCVQLLHQGKGIDYEGASGPMDFSSRQIVFTDVQIVQFDSAGTSLHAIATVPAGQLPS
jgi:ABC-type branched-subunit amino acid transport system substrate-binding protein